MESILLVITGTSIEVPHYSLWSHCFMCPGNNSIFSTDPALVQWESDIIRVRDLEVLTFSVLGLNILKYNCVSKDGQGSLFDLFTSLSFARTRFISNQKEIETIFIWMSRWNADAFFLRVCFFFFFFFFFLERIYVIYQIFKRLDFVLLGQ